MPGVIVNVICPWAAAEELPVPGVNASHDVLLRAAQGTVSVPMFIIVTVTVAVDPCATVTFGTAGFGRSVGEYATESAPAAVLPPAVAAGAAAMMSSTDTVT